MFKLKGIIYSSNFSTLRRLEGSGQQDEKRKTF
jgi:hypothetical protein